MSNKNKFIHVILTNVSYAYLAQLLSMLISMFFMLVIPKNIGVEGYGYWQLLVFYTNYLGVFYIGLNDGLYLRIGGKTYNDLEQSTIGSQCRFFFILHCALAVILIVFTQLSVYSYERRFVIFCVACYLPFFNLNGLLGQLFQAVNKIKIYSYSIIIDKVIILLWIILFAIFRISDFRYYCIVFILSGITACIYSVFKAYRIMFSMNVGIKKTIAEAKKNIFVGLTLMLSSLASLLIIGVSKQIIDIKWSITSFGIVSLSTSILNLFLVFIKKASLVLFPALKGLSNENQIVCYKSLQSILSIFLPVLLVFYVPVGYMISLWIPKYVNSIIYLGILLPICIFDGKMHLLGITYYKVLRLEKHLFFTNLSTFILNSLLSIAGAFLFQDINFIMVGIVVSIALRSIYSELFLSKKLGQKKEYSFIYLCVFSLLFILLNVTIQAWLSCVIYTFTVIIHLFIQKGSIKMTLNELKVKLKNAEISV